MTDRNSSSNRNDETDQVSGFFEAMGQSDRSPTERDGDGTIGNFVAREGGDVDEFKTTAGKRQVFVSDIVDGGGGDGHSLVFGDGLTTIGAAAGSKPNIGSGNLDDLMDYIHSENEQWSYTTLKIGFPDTLNDLPDVLKANYQQPEAGGLDAFVAFNAEQKSNAISAVNHWSEVTDLHFLLAAPGEEADIYFFGRGYPESDDKAGSSTGVDENFGSVITINTEGSSWTNMSPGNYGYFTLLHEVGHSLGFEHPGDYDAGDNANYEDDAPYIQDSRQYTVMSYFGPEDTGATPGESDIVTTRTHDMWVAQKVYGAEWSTRTNDTTYGYNASAETQGSVYEFWPVLGEGPHMTIWDAGGNDWLDLSLDSHDVVLNLNPGTFSSTHGEQKNLSVAYGPDEATPAGKNYLIENARGGFGNDFLIGNNADNVLEGNHGNDFLIGNHGDDTLIGAWGDDTLWGGFGLDFFDGGEDFDTVDFSYSDVDWEFSLYNGTASNQYGTEELHNIEAIIGSNGNDLIQGDGGDNFLDGRDGNDTIEGAMGDDTLFGGDGNDQMSGGMGENELDGGDGVDTLFYMFSTGEWDIDMMTGIATNQYGDIDTFEDFEKVVGSNDADTIAGDTQNNMLYGWDGDDHLLGRAGVDLLFGEGGADTLTGGPGDDIMNGGADIDTVRYEYELAAVTVDLEKVGAQNTGGSGWDTIQEVENIIGSAHDDFLLGNNLANKLFGRSGDDQMFAREGNDTLFGENGDDILEGGLGNDTLNGGDGEDTASYYFSSQGIYADLGAVGSYNTVNAGHDYYVSIENLIGSAYADGLYGDDGNNRLIGNDGNDVLKGKAGIDDLFGGNGNDILIGGASHDFMDGGAGIDWAYYDGSTADLTVDLADKTEQWTGAGTDKLINIENLRGWSGDDDLRGDSGNNHIMGFSGDDTLFGAGGEDTLNGGAGNDVIYAGPDGPSDAPDGLKDLETPDDLPGGRFEIGDYTGLIDDEIFDTGRLLGPTPTVLMRSGGGQANGAMVGDFANELSGGDGGGDGGTRGGSQQIDDVKQLPGSGPDVIQFMANWGDDEVFGFTAGADKLDFSDAWGVSEMADLSINDTNDGVMISNGGNSVLLHDVEQADLSNSDFWF